MMDRKPRFARTLLADWDAWGASPALEGVAAGISLMIAQSAILNNPFFTEAEVRRFLALRRSFHKDFVEATLKFADECEEGKYGSGAMSLAAPLRGISRLLPTQDRQALILVVRVLRGLKNSLHGSDVEPVLRYLVWQASTIVNLDGEGDTDRIYDRFFKTVLKLRFVPPTIKTFLRKIILLGKGTGRDVSLGLAPYEDTDPGAWFELPEEERAKIRATVNESEQIWKDALDQNLPSEEFRAVWLKSQAILEAAKRVSGVHVNIIKGQNNLEPVEKILKREEKLVVDGPTDFLLTELRKNYVKMVSRDKKNIPREARKVLTALSKAKTLDTFQRVIQDAISRGILKDHQKSFLENITNAMGELKKNKAIRDGIPLSPLDWKPMSVPEFQMEHDTGDVDFTEDITEEEQKEILGRVSRAISDLEGVFGKGFCGKHAKKLAFSFGKVGGTAKASYFAWDNKNVWQPRVKFGEDYEGVLAHELSHYLDELLSYKLEKQANPEKPSQFHDNLFGRTGVTMDYMAETISNSDSSKSRDMAEYMPEIKELVQTIVTLPDYARWKDKLTEAHRGAFYESVKVLTGKSIYELPPEHPYYYATLDDANYKSELNPELIAEAEKRYKADLGGDDRKLRYYYSSVEVWARVCEQYVYNKLAKKGVSNPWLNWMTYDSNEYVDEKTFETVLEPILDRLFSRLKRQGMIASLVRRYANLMGRL